MLYNNEWVFFWYQLTWFILDKGPLNECCYAAHLVGRRRQHISKLSICLWVSVCVCLCACVRACMPVGGILRQACHQLQVVLCNVLVRVPPTNSADITPTDAVLSPSNSDFSAVVAETADNVTSSSSGDVLPTQDDVVRKTDRITKRLQELFHAAQEGNCIWYVALASWYCTVHSMLCNKHMCCKLKLCLLQAS